MLRSPLYEALIDLLTGIVLLLGVIAGGLIILWILAEALTVGLILLGLGTAWVIGRMVNSNMREL
jgi:hypothetical protein